MWQRGMCGFVCVVLCGGLWLAVNADEPPAKSNKPDPKPAATEKKPKIVKKESARVTMRKKLAASQDILEGLATEDYEMLEGGAKLLQELAANADFQVSKDMMYIQHSTEFQGLAEKVEKAAKARNLDKAALHYVDLTMNCIECHRFVRDVLIAR